MGFGLCGVAPAVTPTGFSRFLQWLEAGYAGEMQYLESRREAYQHPRSVMEDVRSVLMLGMHYRTADRTPPGTGEGKIARYAWGQVDYHDLIHDRLKQLKRFAVACVPAADVRGVVDTAPLLEREFAQLAGLGWVGKNTLLLNKHEGSFFFLAALLTSFELEPDTPIESDHCGTCTACLDACPTDAFVHPWVLDASKCISYLTIEHRSPVAIDLRDKLDGWVFGCDVCQDVCPWNRKAPVANEDGFWPTDLQNPMPLRELFAIDDEAFRARFRKTPLWRPRRRGMLRNAALVLGGDPQESNIAALMQGLADIEPLVRSASAWALGRHPFAAAQEGLLSRLPAEMDPEVRAEIEMALERFELGA